MQDERDRPDWKSVRTFFNHPTTGPLFPNLRHLRRCSVTDSDNMYLLHPPLPLPSIVYLILDVQTQFARRENLQTFENSLESFRDLVPNTKRLHIDLCRLMSRSTQSPLVIFAVGEILNMCFVLESPRTLALLCTCPARPLAFKQSATLPDQIASSRLPLIFSNLQHLELHSQSWALVEITLPDTTACYHTCFCFH